MPDILKSDNNVTRRNIDMLDGTWAERAAMAIVGTSGVEAGVNAFGQLRVITETTSLFTDEFDTLDTVNRWTLKTSGGSVTAGAGTVTVNGSASANSWGGIQSQPTFQSIGLNILAMGGVFLFPNTTIANTKRFFGWGTIPATPTLAVPITDGCGFEIDESGAIWAVVYESGVRSPRSVNISTAAALTNNTPIVFLMGRRSDVIHFYVTTNQKPDASIALPGLDVTSLPAAFLSVTGAVAPTSAPTFLCFGLGIGDSGCNAGSIKDPINPFWQAAVTKPSTPVLSTQSALAVALHPTSPLPVPAVPDTPYFVNSAASTNGALIATGTSGLQSFFASNTGASDAFVKLYNKATAPTVGTDVPEMVIRVLAGSNIELTPGLQGYRFPLGLGIAITGLAADTDTTAVAAGQVKVKLSRTV
jgi:hypothetical protein